MQSIYAYNRFIIYYKSFIISILDNIIMEDFSNLAICAIHLSYLNDPILLNCQHSFCRSCIINWIEKGNDKACPVCRAAISYTSREILGLQVSLVHKQLSELARKKEASESGVGVGASALNSKTTKNKTPKIRVSLVGSMSSGKTSIMRCLAGFPFVCVPHTIGVELTFINVKIDNQLVKVELWDTAGQEIYRTIVRSYYRKSHGIIIVYDVTDEESFQDVESWITDINRHRENEPIILLLGNKIDLNRKRVVTEERARTLANRYNFLYYDVSAKTGANVAESFERLIAKIWMINLDEVLNTSAIQLREEPAAGEEETRSGCC